MTHRILLVEDDDSIRQIATMSLQLAGGYEVLAVESGAEAIRQASAFAPDLMVLDVSMPGMDGPQTLQALRSLVALADVPAVFLTARTQASDVTRLRALGALDVIAKPFDPKHLCDRVQAILDRPAASAGPAPAPVRPCALVIEDDPGIRFLLTFILEQEGWQIRTAEDGPQGLQAINEGELPQALLLDIMLPGIDGLALLEHLRAQSRWADVPVMMLTAKGDEASVQRALALGAQDYLGKPFDPQELAARLQRMTPSVRR
jgi:DNA-binding response OmpR family regulator